MSLLPPPEAINPDPATAFNAIQLHAKEYGYAFMKRNKGLVRFAYGASIFAYISNMKIEVEHVKYGLTIALSTIRPGGGPYSILLGDEDMDL